MAINGDKDKFMKSMDAMIASLCPPATSINLTRFDTPNSHRHNAIYEADRAQLKVSQTSIGIRSAYCGEFDYTPSIQLSMEQYPTLELQKVALPNDLLRTMMKQIPALWCSIADLGNKTIQVTAIYRGKAFWPVEERDGRMVARFKSADDVYGALAAIQSSEGLNKQQWEAFCREYWDAAALDSASESSERVH